MMPPTYARTPPPWFRGLAILFLLWGVAGVVAFGFHVMMGAGAVPVEDRARFLSLPRWFAWLYAVATVGGLWGAVSLVLRRQEAVTLFLVSAAAIAVQFGWMFLATDLIAAKGPMVAMSFPVLIFALALIQWSVARRGVRRGWLR